MRPFEPVDRGDITSVNNATVNKAIEEVRKKRDRESTSGELLIEAITKWNV
jgi:hypothetical protein